MPIYINDSFWKKNWRQQNKEMQQMNQNQNIEQSYRTLVIIWFALLNSQLLLLVVLYFAKPKIFEFDFSKSHFSESSILVIVLAALGILTFLLSFVLSRKFINQAVSEQKRV